MPIVGIKLLIALAMDQWLGEPRRWHPLVSFGRLANALERAGNHGSPRLRLLLGTLAWATAVLPWVLVAFILSTSPVGALFDIALLYLALGRKSLFEHSQRVWQALTNNDLEQARYHTGMMVSRETTHLDADGCARATIESVLENANDGIVGALFWFTVAGAPGVVLFRLANTLDAMWGYRSERFLYFGRASARIDDLLNVFPARICALAYALAGNTRVALQSWRSQAHQLQSPNGGPVMSAGAGALNIRLGGPAIYHGQLLDKPFFGGTTPANLHHIARAQQLVDRALGLLLILALALNLWVITCV